MFLNEILRKPKKNHIRLKTVYEKLGDPCLANTKTREGDSGENASRESIEQ